MINNVRYDPPEHQRPYGWPPRDPRAVTDWQAALGRVIADAPNAQLVIAEGHSAARMEAEIAEAVEATLAPCGEPLPGVIGWPMARDISLDLSDLNEPHRLALMTGNETSATERMWADTMRGLEECLAAVRRHGSTIIVATDPRAATPREIAEAPETLHLVDHGIAWTEGWVA